MGDRRGASSDEEGSDDEGEGPCVERDIASFRGRAAKIGEFRAVLHFQNSSQAIDRLVGRLKAQGLKAKGQQIRGSGRNFVTREFAILILASEFQPINSAVRQ